MSLALRLAWRELRASGRDRVRGMRIVLACLALGVATIAGVGGLRESLSQGLAAEGRRLLGGDLEIDTGSLTVPPELRDFLTARGARLSAITQMRSLLAAPSGARQLVELKAVDAAWPLVGPAGFAPALSPATVLADGGVAVEQVVLDRLRLRPGDTVRLGNAVLTLRAALIKEPDNVASPLMAPRALIALSTLAHTELDVPGAILRHAVRAVWPAGDMPADVVAELAKIFPDHGWRIRQPGEAAPGISRFIAQTGQFMTLVGLTALLVGGIGVANGVRAWLIARAATLASLRCLGASARLLLTMCLAQVMALAALGTAVGLAVGAVLPWLAIWLMGDVLPVAPRVGVFVGPLLLAAGFGLLTAACFALLPLGRAARIPGAALFRDAQIPHDARAVWRVQATTGGLSLGLVALTVLASPDRWLAGWFCAGAVGALGIFRLGGFLLVRLARIWPRPRVAWARLGLGNLHRPGTPVPLMLVSVGLGLSTLASVAMIHGNLHAHVLAQIPAQAPSFFFIDIQSAQLATFTELLARTPGVSDVKHVPSLRARIVAVNGVPAAQAKATPETQWALRGDRGLTYAALPPGGTHIVAGTWWAADYRGPPLVSLDAQLAAGWGVKIGDIIRVNVLGRDIDLRVENLRQIAWRSLGINFALVTSPGLLEQAPHTHIATLRATPETQGAVLRAVSDALPNVAGIRVEEVLRSLSNILDQIALALTATGGITLLSGMLVLAGAVAAGQARRVREAVLLKTLGASRAQIRAAWLTEFLAFGLTAGLLAGLVGTASAWSVVRFVLRADFVFLPGRLALTLLAALILMLVTGYLGTAAALRAKAAPLLRNV